jgi:hypothetical protein
MPVADTDIDTEYYVIFSRDVDATDREGKHGSTVFRLFALPLEYDSFKRIEGS